MIKDKAYYRAYGSRALIEEVHELRPDWEELARALAERMHDMLRTASHEWTHCPHCNGRLD